ncbi:MAG: hypothetical protein ACPLZG_11365 [Thermoproteota archaeon]|jgi:hypothetical protein
MDERPLWEIKAVALLLLAVSILARYFNIITQELFNSVLFTVVNYFLLNASAKADFEIMSNLKALGKSTTIFSVSLAIKILFVALNVLVAIAFYLKFTDFDTLFKITQVVTVLLLANIGYAEYKLQKVR